MLTLDVAQKMVETMPDATLVEIERAGHMVFEDNPEDFNNTVDAWLAQG